jgi:hypothetical protein
MKPILFTVIALLTIFVTGCAPLINSQSDAKTPISIAQPAVEVSTAQGGGQAVALPSSTPNIGGVVTPAIDKLPADGVITLSDNGKTFSMQVGESFLLNLGTDVYDWTVEVDNQDVLQRKEGVTVIRGAQGVYVAQAPGTAILTANGDPHCLQSKPACKMPSILFSITVIVK